MPREPLPESERRRRFQATIRPEDFAWFNEVVGPEAGKRYARPAEFMDKAMQLMRLYHAHLEGLEGFVAEQVARKDQ